MCRGWHLPFFVFIKHVLFLTDVILITTKTKLNIIHTLSYLVNESQIIINDYYHWNCEFESRFLTRCTWYNIIDKGFQWLISSRWIYLGSPVSSINKTGSHDITEILLKVAFNTITTPLKIKFAMRWCIHTINLHLNSNPVGTIVLIVYNSNPVGTIVLIVYNKNSW